MKSLAIIGEPISNRTKGADGSADSCDRSPKITMISGGNDVAIRNYQGKAAVVTLGCAKNHVDSEVMLGHLYNRGFEIVSDVQEADVAIVNTCGFLQSAVQESIDCILDIAELKKTGRLRRLVVAGCMVERFKTDLKSSMPEVDAFIGVNELANVVRAAGVDEASDPITDSARPYFLYDDTMPRALATKPYTSWVKVSEGCNRPCTFCIIPKIRGTMRSRKLQSVVREVQALGSKGVREVNLVAQDLTAYGTDLIGSAQSTRTRIVDLLRSLDAARAVDWIRILYAYPVGVDEELLRALVQLPTVTEYLDVPLQHASERVLKEMRRPVGRYAARPFAEFVKGIAPEIAIRTTFIVGFPGETEKDVEELAQLVRENYFSSVGVFTYSKEIGTPSAEMKGHISQKEKDRRRDYIMEVQQESQARQLQSFIGKEIEVLLEGFHDDSDLLLVGRSRFQAPEVDGSVIINDVAEGLQGLNPGSLCRVSVAEVSGYDLIGKIVAVRD